MDLPVDADEEQGPAGSVERRSPSDRVARNRRRRADQYLDAALRIVVDEGFEALTMAKLAEAVDAAVGSVYRYYPSKADLLSAMQGQAVERLTLSFDDSVPALVALVEPEVAAEQRSYVPLAALGRWACAAAAVLPEEVRLLQMVSARRTSAVGPGAGAQLVPVILGFLGRVVAIVETAADRGVISPEPSGPRAIVWLTALGGVLEIDDLEQYRPDLVGGQRLARQLTVDLYCGWGADRASLLAIDSVIDDIERDGPLAR